MDSSTDRGPGRPARQPRWMLPAAATLLLLVAAAGVWWVVGRPPPPVQTRVTVLSTQQWTQTGITVAAGQRVAVAASGQINHNETDTIGPDGFPNRPDLLTPLPSAHHAELLGRVADGAPVFLGAAGSFVADRAGELELGINDLGLENNAGTFTPVVTTESP